MIRYRFLVMLVGLALLLPGCGGGRPVTDANRFDLPDGALCDDLVLLPQDLTPYAERAGLDTPLLSPGEQMREDAAFNAKFFAAWEATRPGLSPGAVMEAARNLDPARGFIENLRPFPPERWQALVDNCSIASYSQKGPVRHAITVEDADVRRMPTNLPFFLNPGRPGEGYPFDYFQASSLWIGTPVVITHVSRDGAWAHIESNLVAGWLPVQSVAVVDETFKREWRSHSLGAVIRDDSPMGTLDAGDLVNGWQRAYRLSIGTVLPLAGVPRKAPETTVLVPVRGETGKALVRVGALDMWAVAAKPLPLTPGNLAGVGNGMMGQPYGWGGLHGQRDCSSATKDLFVPFGIWMPRNSRGQNAYGAILDLKGLSADEKERRIAEEGIPFLSLVSLPGHVALYLGTYPKGGRDVPVMFHNLWGLRTKPANGGQDAPQGRIIIGRAAVTTLRPGAEHPLISSPASLLDRITGLSTLPGRPKQ